MRDHKFLNTIALLHLDKTELITTIGCKEIITVIYVAVLGHGYIQMLKNGAAEDEKRAEWC